MNGFSHIQQYILFLKSEHGLSVSLHPSPSHRQLLLGDELLSFNLHDHAYCSYIKRHVQNGSRCRACQDKVHKVCQTGPFIGTCFAGVREYIYPFTNGTETVGFLSVSGYRTEQEKSYRHRLAETHDLCPSELKAAYRTLSPNLPDKSKVDALLYPLCDMIELAYRKAQQTATEPALIEQILQFIKQNRNESISSKDICERFYCSRSYMSTLFNKHTGKTLRAYITELRIADAKALLERSDLSVTEIAYTVGFCNANYFADIFKKQVGVSPLQYKRASRT